MNDDQERLLKSFQIKLFDLEKESSEITRAQFEKLYLERAQAVGDEILRDFQGALQDFLKNNPDVSEDLLKAAVNEYHKTHEPLPRIRILCDPSESIYREYMSHFAPVHFRHLVDQYLKGVRAP